MAQRFVGGMIFAALLAPIPGQATPPASTLIVITKQPSWHELSPQQRTILAPLAGEWNRMEDLRRKKWLNIADRYPRMPISEQDRMQNRMHRWASMTTAERKQARENYQKFRQLPPEKKAAVKREWENHSQRQETPQETPQESPL